jgi:hypothetical protein
MSKDRLDIISWNWDEISGIYYCCDVYLGWILFLPWRDVQEETVITGVPTSGSHSEHQFVSTLKHTWTLPEDGFPPGERSCGMNQNCHNQSTLSNESVKFLWNRLSLFQSEILRVQQITTTKYIKPLIPYATQFQDRTRVPRVKLLLNIPQYWQFFYWYITPKTFGFNIKSLTYTHNIEKKAEFQTHSRWVWSDMCHV